MKIYLASKLDHVKMMQAWRDEASRQGIGCTSSWLDLVGMVPDDHTYAKTFWTRNFNDVANADVVICFAEEHMHLRGALVEVGFAIGHGKPAIIVGDHPDYGTWQYSGAVYHADDLRSALWTVKHLFGG